MSLRCTHHYSPPPHPRPHYCSFFLLPHTTPIITMIYLLSGVQAIVAGYRQSMVLKRNGSVWTTGYNQGGELGDGTYENKNRFEMVISTGE